MKSNKKILFALILILAMFFALAIAASAAVTPREGNMKSDGSLKYSLDADGVLTISGTATTLAFDTTVNWNDAGKVWKEEKWAGDIYKVVVTAPITSISQYVLSHLFNLVEIEVPASLTSLPSGMFNNCNKLERFKVTGVDYSGFEAQYYDLRNITKIDSWAFDASCASVSPVIYLNKNIQIGFSKFAQTNTAGVKFKLFPGSNAYLYVKGIMEETPADFCKNISYEYYTAEDYPELALTGKIDKTGSGWTNGFHWELDLDANTLYIKNTDGTSEASTNQTAFKNFKSYWQYEIKTVIVERFNKITGSAIIDYPCVETMLFTNSIEFGNTFTNLPMLKTMGLVSSYEENVVDLKVISSMKFDPKNLLANCASVEKVIFPTAINFNSNAFASTGSFSGCSSLKYIELPAYTTIIGENAFLNCTSLEQIVIPSSVKSIASNAFAGCTALRKITLSGADTTVAANALPSGEGIELTVKCASEAQANAILELGLVGVYADYFEDSLNMDGFSIRYEGENGLRAIFSFDNVGYADVNAKFGYELVEYGVLVVTADNYNKLGAIDIISDGNGGYKAASDAVISVPVYNSANGYVGRVLREPGDKTEFALTIKNYTSNHNSDVYMGAYVVYTDKNGEEVVSIADYSEHNADYKFFSLYRITLDMYIRGVVNSKNTDDSAVWNTLLTGAVTFKAGTDYTYSESDPVLDLAGEDVFAESFAYVNIPAVSQSIVTEGDAKILTFKDSGLDITLVKNYVNGTYVAIYRGTGVVPETGLYTSVGSMHQLSNSFAALKKGSGTATAVSANRPHPTLNSAACAKIDTIILDEGITTVSKEGFAQLKALTTFVYPESLTKFSAGLFLGDSAVKTAYRAETGEDSANITREVGLIELSQVNTIDTSYMFNGANSIEKVHLPAGLALNTKFACGESTTLYLNTLWCGDNARPEKGVIDLRGCVDTALNQEEFTNANLIEIMILPESIESITASAFKNCSAKINFRQESCYKAIYEFCENNGHTYTDLDGNAHPEPPADVPTEASEGWSGIIVD